MKNPIVISLFALSLLSTIVVSLLIPWFKTMASEYENIGVAGDYWGGLLGSLFGFITICLLIYTIHIQQEELRTNNVEFRELNQHNKNREYQAFFYELANRIQSDWEELNYTVPPDSQQRFSVNKYNYAISMIESAYRKLYQIALDKDGGLKIAISNAKMFRNLIPGLWHMTNGHQEGQKRLQVYGRMLDHVSGKEIMETKEIIHKLFVALFSEDVPAIEDYDIFWNAFAEWNMSVRIKLKFAGESSVEIGRPKPN